MLSFLCFQKCNFWYTRCENYVFVCAFYLFIYFFMCVTVLQETRVVVAAERPRHSTTHTKSRL